MDGPQKPSVKRISNSPPPKSSDIMPKQSKMPRLDSASVVSPSSIADPAIRAPAAPAPVDDSKLLLRAKDFIDAGDLPLALLLIFRHDEKRLQANSVFHQSGWNNLREVKKALAQHPKLGDLIKKCIEQGTFEPLRQHVKKLRELKAYWPRAIYGWPFQDKSEALAKAWKEQYKGDSASLLVAVLHAMNSDRPQKDYDNFVPIIQSSGMGKSRTVDEAAKFVFTLPFNLRSNNDSTAYPPPHQKVRDFFNPNDIECFSRHKLEHRYLRFFQELFGMVNTRLSEVGPCETFEAFALAWHSEFTETKQNELYGEVVKNSLKELETNDYREGGGLADARKEVKVSAQELIDTIIQKSTPNGWASSGAAQTEEKDTYMRPVRMILYFDELHGLISKFTKDQGAEIRSAYQVLCKSLDSILEEDIFVIHLSTSLNLSRYSPQQGHSWSLRGTSSGLVAPVDLQAPFVELPFDVFATVKEDRTKLTDVSEVEHMVKFGRPLFHTMYKAGHRNMVEFATQKLYAHESNDNDNGRLAALSIRLLLEFEPLRELAREKEAELVAGHMRVAYSVPQHRLYIRSGTPSEPLLAEASAYIMVNLPSSPSSPGDITCKLLEVVTLLEKFLNHGLISKGKRGELVGRLILTLAHDKAILIMNRKWGLNSKVPASTVLFSKPVGVVEFLEALISSQYIQSVKDSRPVNVHDGPTLHEAFAGAKLNFTHFVKGGDASIVTDEVAWMALARCMAFACANNQRTIDLYIPTLLWDEKLSRWVVSGIFVQFKNCTTAEKVTIDATKLGFFTHADPSDENAERYNTRPYITIVMNMGVQPKPSKQPKKTMPQTPLKPTVLVGLARSEATETGPARAQPKRKTKTSTNTRAVHPRYAINITGYSYNVYGVLSTDSKQRLKYMISAHDFLHENPRTEEKFRDAVRDLKPFWAKNEGSFHWATESKGGEDTDEDEGVFVGDAADDEFSDDIDG